MIKRRGNETKYQHLCRVWKRGRKHRLSKLRDSRGLISFEDHKKATMTPRELASLKKHTAWILKNYKES